jgi:plasmid stabilization system protein ParE
VNYRVQIADKALADVEGVLTWFRDQEATEAGGRWFNALWKAVDTLETRPERCSLAAEAEDIGREIRELLFGRRRGQYRILFEIRGRTVHILRVWHSARKPITREDIMKPPRK